MMESVMEILKRLLSVFFLLVAAAVAVNWVATPLYHDGTANYWLWEAMNWPMAVAVGLALIVNAVRKCRSQTSVSGGSVTRQYLEVNLAFYASIVLALWFYWNWFYSLFPESEPEAVGLIHLEWWAFINPLLVLVVGATGARLWREATAND
jgi:hypothetical protein